jgi:predicted outer membrane repeat protein
MAGVSNPKIQWIIPMLVAVPAILCTAAMGKTIDVGDGGQADFDNIQAGIDVADDGDTILVALGEYVITEPVTFRGKAITVKSEAGPDETTIRMGTPADTNRGSVVVFENGETTESILEGFTITGGSGSSVLPLNEFCGGGILFNASSGTVVNCTIVQNSARHGGGVIAFSESSMTLIDCAVADNTAKNGGGVMVYSGSSATLTNCIISGNSATGVTFGVDGYGGGLFCGPNSLLTLISCSFTENSAVRGGGGIHCWQNLSFTMNSSLITSNTVQYAGGGMVCDSGSAILNNCIIARNTGARWGGGLCIAFANSSMTIINCTIWGNSATEGGGIDCISGGSAIVTNSILWNNTATSGNEIYLEQAPTEFSITYSNVAGGRNAVTIKGGSVLNWDTVNIDVNPCFADPNNENYHLKSQAGRWDPNSQIWILDEVTSPCVDAGDPNSDLAVELWPHGERINMGAYGGTSQASRSLSDAGNIADLNRDGIVDSADMCMMVDYWHTYEPICDISPIPFGDGIVDVQDLIILAEHLFEEIPPTELVE